MAEKLTNIPTNLIMGFLGVGKTTAILELLKQKPKNENWAVLVNEFGKIGIDGAIFSAAGATVKEIPGGCLCCAVAVPFQVTINRLLKEVRPDRLLIEPTGLGHPKKVLDMLLSDAFKDVLDLRASICLVDPEKLKDNRYTTHENFVDQIALSDVLVANKMDLADVEAVELFYHWAEKSKPTKAMIAQTTQGQLDVVWLDISRNHQRQASYPNAHQITKIKPVDSVQSQFNNFADGYQDFGFIFPIGSCFDFRKLNKVFSQFKVERIKAVLYTNKGWYIVNCATGNITITPTLPATNSRIEIIDMKNYSQDFSTALNLCRIDNIES
jgi:G3E family GTPase